MCKCPHGRKTDEWRTRITHYHGALAQADVSPGPCFLDEASLATNSTGTALSLYVISLY